MLGCTPRFHFANASDLSIRPRRDDRIFWLVMRLPLEILLSPDNLPRIAVSTASLFAATHPAPAFVIRQPFFLSPSTSDPYFSLRRSVSVTLTASTSGYLWNRISPKRSG